VLDQADFRNTDQKSGQYFAGDQSQIGKKNNVAPRYEPLLDRSEDETQLLVASSNSDRSEDET